ncbi:ATP-dependent DNA helicase pfh1-like [Photinus pyralis]|uniref:ATP-dependent DNA helicase pfh1-like n=1 Tax=Photinus pyralis TaxID=7054 RepID=UPI00126763B7|nr:ATP-dependent DNA helicase pfh1-like [Photinus pyralis]
MACNLRSNKVTIIDEISFLSSRHFDQISSNMKQVFKSRNEFAGLSIIVVGDFNQLRPIGAPYCFQPKSRCTTAALVDNPQWAPFRMFELTEIMRQKDDLRFAEALSRLAVGATTSNDNRLFESRCFTPETLPVEARSCLRLIAFNEDVYKYNIQRAQELIRSGARQFIYTAIDRFIGTYTDNQKKKAKHVLALMKPGDTQGLVAELHLVIGLRYMISTNIDVCDGLFNGACGVLRFVELRERCITAVYMEFDDEKTGALARRGRYDVMRANSQIQPNWTPIKLTNRNFNTTERGKVQVNRVQFPMVMAEAITIHKSQGRSERLVCVDVEKGMNRQKYYVAFSRATTLNGLFILGKFKPPGPVEANDPIAFILVAKYLHFKRPGLYIMSLTTFQTSPKYREIG